MILWGSLSCELPHEPDTEQTAELLTTFEQFVTYH